MHKAAAAPRWYQVWRVRPMAVGPDPADQGTAFGMEMSLGAGADDAPAPASGPRRTAPHWTTRLRLRRGNSG